ncbi:MAG TPA: YbaB/EbfC family nucleoid-associated protein [Candidatus Omnitrophota bacterium]|nr:YbaB/EbfC family nucleoid-associated protein [Candidatus Omnitrophota bacterium]HNQ51336.1 YbaB/EbfC family nucleoid-associated protein [Candidatus Omnitrophota bacterium]HQO38664.1 YbaB/EbfC family nucleoid-associated protein [Candidatus Omnitrophota bacterium]HQQ06028.1 YbaB/EbfC family nucleoid-associated protein [Candidatus Omnitrophota bacterium]
MFDKIKGLMEMQKKMQEVKRQLDALTFEVKSADGSVTVAMNGSQEVQSVAIAGSLAGLQKDALERQCRDTFNAAIRRAQGLAAQKMRDITGVNLPGM